MTNRLHDKLQKIIFQSLVFFLPSQFGKHFWPDWSKIYGIRVDYFSPTIYFTDILVLLLFALTIPGILQYIKRLHNRKKRKFSMNKRLVLISLAVIFICINFSISANKWIALLKWGKLLEIYFIVIYIITDKKIRFKNWILYPAVASLIYVIPLMVYQLVFQKSLNGWAYLLGERRMSFYTIGISKFNILGKYFMRPYSTFSHPNSLSGYLVVIYVLLFTKTKPICCVRALRALLLVAVILTASLNAVLVLIMVFIYLILKKRFSFNEKKIFTIWFFLILLLSILHPALLKDRFSVMNNESIRNRVVLGVSAYKMLEENPLFGVGLNNFIYFLPRLAEENNGVWILQPVHNMVLLIFAELGIFGLLFFSVIIIRAIKNNYVYKNNISMNLTLALVSILTLGLLDHYFLTLQQNQLLFGIILGLTYRKNLV